MPLQSLLFVIHFILSLHILYITYTIYYAAFSRLLESLKYSFLREGRFEIRLRKKEALGNRKILPPSLK